MLGLAAQAGAARGQSAGERPKRRGGCMLGLAAPAATQPERLVGC